MSAILRRMGIPSKHILAKYGEWKKPSESTAASSTLDSRRHHDTLLLCNTSYKDLRQFGKGLTLYFHLLLCIAILFTAIFVFFGSPAIFVYYMGNLYEENSMDAMTLGNVGHFHDLNYSLANFTIDHNNVEIERALVDVFREDSKENSVLLTNWVKIKKERALLIISILAAFIPGVFFFVAVFFLPWIQRHVAAKVDSEVVTVADYSVKVEGLPTDTTATELKAFFSQWGRVFAVEVVKTDCELIERARIGKKVTDDVNVAIASATKIATQEPNGTVNIWHLANIRVREFIRDWTYSHTSSLLRNRQSAKAICAFVTMEKSEQCIDIINAFPRSFGRRLFSSRNRSFRGMYWVKAMPAPEPADIIWENLNFSVFNRTLRSVVTIMINLFALFLGFLVVNLAMTLRRKDPPAMDLSQCDNLCQYFDYAGQLTLSDALKDRYKNCYRGFSDDCSVLESSCYQCYCENAVIGTIDLSASSYCSTYLADYATAAAREIVIVVIGLVGVNQVLSFMASKLAKAERHHTRTREEASTAIALFRFQFINTAISTLVATSYISRLKSFVEGTVLDDLLFVGVYVDTTPNWYRDTGRSLTITMIVQFGSRILMVGWRWIWHQYKFWRRSSAVTQHQLNAAYLGPEFTLAFRYGEWLNLIFVTMLFGSGMPLVYLIAAASLWLQFFAEKTELLRLCQKPTSFGTDLAKRSANLLPYASVFHFCFSAWAFSLQHTERSPLVGRLVETSLEWTSVFIGYMTSSDNKENDSRAFAERLMQVTSAHHVILIIVLLLIIIARGTMSFWLKVLKRICTFLGIIKDTGLNSDKCSRLPDIATAISSGQLLGPRSYALQSNPQYMSALPSKNWNSLEKKSDQESKRKDSRSIQPPARESVVSTTEIEPSHDLEAQDTDRL